MTIIPTYKGVNFYKCRIQQSSVDKLTLRIKGGSTTTILTAAVFL